MFQMVTCRLVSSLTGQGLYVSRAGVAVALPGPGGSGPQELTSAVDAFNKAMSMVILEYIETSNIADIKASLDTIYTREPGAAWQIRGYDIYSQATGYGAGKNPDLAYSRTVYEGEITPSPQNLLPMITTMNEVLRQSVQRMTQSRGLSSITQRRIKTCSIR